MAKRTPALYATGQWRVTTPYTVVATAVYSCQAIRSIRELEAQGVDPYATFYEPVGITRDVYNVDVANLPNIITLMSDTAPTLYIPDTYIASYPALDTIPYRHAVLSISLGPVPDSLALDDLKDKMREITLMSVGVESEVLVHQAGSVAEGVTSDQHQVLEQARRARMDSNETYYAKYLSAEDTNQKLRDRIKALEAALAARGGVTS